MLNAIFTILFRFSYVMVLFCVSLSFTFRRLPNTVICKIWIINVNDVAVKDLLSASEEFYRSVLVPLKWNE